MLKEYFSSLEDTYGFTGNWEPSESVQVGDWVDVKSGFLPWLKNAVGIENATEDLNRSLHNIMKNSLSGVATKRKKKAPMLLYHDVSVEVGVSGGPASIKALKKGGFFAIFQDVYEVSADPESFKNGLSKVDKTSIAIVSGITYVNKGILVVFSHDAASITLPIKGSLETMLNDPALIDLDFALSYQSEGVIAFQAEPGKELYPFVKIHTVGKKQEIQRNLRRSAMRRTAMMPQGNIAQAFSSPRLEDDYVIEPFSYTDFLSKV